MLQALRYLRENPEGTQQAMMTWLKLDREMAADIYQMAINNYTRNGMVEEATMNSLVTKMLAEAGIKGVAPSQLTISRCYSKPSSKRDMPHRMLIQRRVSDYASKFISLTDNL